NAVQAMPEGGIVTIHGENIAITEGSELPLQKGRYVKMSIRDGGCGIPKEDLGRIFDPYFTTKQKASGLGLTTAYYIVQRHGGYIHLESEPGRGTTCSIYLRASDSRPAVTDAGQHISSGNGKILFMDDEEILRDFTGRMLKKIGYEVELASDGREAVELFAKAKDTGRPFDIVIMDLTVPGGMGGKEAMQKLREIYSGVKGIVSSGYSNDPIMANYGEYGFKAVVTKPYTLQEISNTIKAVMDDG
ncbi:MAG: ATP-binding protein, partial [Nitrospirota bacterium]